MAIQKIRLIRLTWKNDDNFKMETNLNDGDWNTVAEIDENDYFDDIWENGIKPACKRYFVKEIDKIGAEMKA